MSHELLDYDYDSDYGWGESISFSNYNYFFVDGIRAEPHLMETYAGLAHLRKIANINDDDYPDYHEFRFIDSSNYIAIRDSIPFYWEPRRELYITRFNRRWFRYY